MLSLLMTQRCISEAMRPTCACLRGLLRSFVLRQEPRSTGTSHVDSGQVGGTHHSGSQVHSFGGFLQGPQYVILVARLGLI